MPVNVGAQQTPEFQPAMRQVIAITPTNPVSVTTSFAHNYFTNDIVRIIVPIGQGMQQINQQYAPITVTGPTTFTMAINGIGFQALNIPVNALNFPQSLNIAEATLGTPGALYNTLPSLVRIANQGQ